MMSNVVKASSARRGRRSWASQDDDEDQRAMIEAIVGRDEVMSNVVKASSARRGRRSWASQDNDED